MGYRPALDGLRAIAIAAVVGGHVYDWPMHGGNGVELFFVLSGFLITSLLLEERRLHAHVLLPAFYRRRAYRLLPALYVMLAVFLLLSAIEGHLTRHVWVGLAAGVAYITNFLGISFAGIPFELQVLWTLAQEEQFYVLWPPLLFLVLRGRPRAGMAAAASIAGLAVVQDYESAHGGLSWAGSGPLTQSFGIVVGCFLALAVTEWPWLVARARALTLPSLAATVGMLIYLPGTSFYPWPFVVFCLVCSVVVAAAFEGTSATARYVLASPPAIFLGRISYSLYLWSVLVEFEVYRRWGLGSTTRPIVIVASVAVASASFFLIELPFLRRKRRLAQVPKGDSGKPRVGRRLSAALGFGDRSA